jgi:hypothetical protein
MEKKISVEDDLDLREIQKNLKEMVNLEEMLRQIQERKNLKEMQEKKKRDDDKWDINQMSEFDFVRCDYSQW